MEYVAPPPQAPPQAYVAPYIAPYIAPPQAYAAPPSPLQIPPTNRSAGVVEVRCPSCSMMTMATPGLVGVCFSCGQPLPANVSPESAGQFPLTNAMSSSALRPPVSPYAASSGAVLFGAPGNFAVHTEVRVGRDPAQCGIVLQEPRVSGVHATLKFEASQLWVKDEQSNNGTFVDGNRLAPFVWTPVRPGALLKFGPAELNVRLE